MRPSATHRDICNSHRRTMLEGAICLDDQPINSGCSLHQRQSGAILAFRACALLLRIMPLFLSLYATIRRLLPGCVRGIALLQIDPGIKGVTDRQQCTCPLVVANLHPVTRLMPAYLIKKLPGIKALRILFIRN